MRRLSNRQKRSWARLSQARGERNARQRIDHRWLIWRRRIRLKAYEPVRLVAPRKLTLAPQKAGPTINFLRGIYSTVVEQGRHCTVDLSNVETVAVGPALALVAELQRCEELCPHHLQGIRPTAPVPRLLLEQIGFFEATDRDLISTEHPSARILKIKTGLTQDVERTEFLERLLGSFVPDGALSAAILSRVQGAITEALLNVIDHAYPADFERDDKCPSHRWWICGVTDPDTKTIIFLVYDLGIGIPATVPRSEVSGVRQLFSKLAMSDREKDGKLIEIAVKAPRSQTGLQGRGRGLPEMRRLIDRVGEGRLWITSGRGQYLYDPKLAGEEVCADEGVPLRGTLVSWQLRLVESQDVRDVPGDGHHAG